MAGDSTTFPPPPPLSKTAARIDSPSMTASPKSGGTGPGAMRKQHHLTVRTLLPRHLPPQEVVAALQSYAPVMKHKSGVTRFEPSTAAPACLADPFFQGGSPVAYPAGREGGGGDVLPSGRLAVFNVFERVPLIPGIASKEITFPVTFQDIPDGIRCRADAPAGVVAWSIYVVRPKAADSQEDPAAAAATAPAAADWEAEVDRRREYELAHWVTVETNTLLMPFVARTMEGAHKDLCQKVLDEVAVRFRWD